MEEDFDIYDDLDEFAEKAQKPSAEVSELNEKLVNVTAQLTEVQRKQERLIDLNKTLKYNISTILLTARREISRKDERINELVREKDSIIFKRSGPKSGHSTIPKPKTWYNDQETQTTCSLKSRDRGTQTENVNVKTMSIFPSQKLSKGVQTEKQKILNFERLSNTKLIHQTSQTDASSKPFQTVNYVERHSDSVKTELIEFQEFVEKRHQSVQTDKNSEIVIASENNNNIKSVLDNSDVVESLLVLSQGYYNSDIPQPVINEDYEKLLMDRQAILDELTKDDSIDKSTPIKHLSKSKNKVEKKKRCRSNDQKDELSKNDDTPKKRLSKSINKTPPRPNEELNTNLDIYELSPIHQMDKSKPIRQYASENDKQNLNPLEILNDCITSSPKNLQKDEYVISNVNSERTQNPATDVNPISTQIEKIKTIQPENIKQPRKQKFTDVKTNCNLEHIPTESISPTSKITRTRKRRFDAILDESMEEVAPKRNLRSTIPVQIETKEDTSESKPEPILNNDSTELAISPGPKHSVVELECPPALNNTTQVESKCEGSGHQPLPFSPVEAPQMPQSNIDNQKSLECSDPKLKIAPQVLISPLPPSKHIENTFSSPSSGEQPVLNSSVEIKMSKTSYKIETLGDETTVYIRRNKKKKKREL